MHEFVLIRRRRFGVLSSAGAVVRDDDIIDYLAAQLSLTGEFSAIVKGQRDSNVQVKAGSGRTAVVSAGNVESARDEDDDNPIDKIRYLPFMITVYVDSREDYVAARDLTRLDMLIHNRIGADPSLGGRVIPRLTKLAAAVQADDGHPQRALRITGTVAYRRTTTTYDDSIR